MGKLILIATFMSLITPYITNARDPKGLNLYDLLQSLAPPTSHNDRQIKNIPESVATLMEMVKSSEDAQPVLVRVLQMFSEIDPNIQRQMLDVIKWRVATKFNDMIRVFSPAQRQGIQLDQEHLEEFMDLIKPDLPVTEAQMEGIVRMLSLFPNDHHQTLSENDQLRAVVNMLTLSKNHGLEDHFSSNQAQSHSREHMPEPSRRKRSANASMKEVLPVPVLPVLQVFPSSVESIDVEPFAEGEPVDMHDVPHFGDHTPEISTKETAEETLEETEEETAEENAEETTEETSEESTEESMEETTEDQNELLEALGSLFPERDPKTKMPLTDMEGFTDLIHTMFHGEGKAQDMMAWYIEAKLENLIEHNPAMLTTLLSVLQEFHTMTNEERALAIKVMKSHMVYQMNDIISDEDISSNQDVMENVEKIPDDDVLEAFQDVFQDIPMENIDNKLENDPEARDNAKIEAILNEIMEFDSAEFDAVSKDTSASSEASESDPLEESAQKDHQKHHPNSSTESSSSTNSTEEQNESERMDMTSSQLVEEGLIKVDGLSNELVESSEMTFNDVLETFLIDGSSKEVTTEHLPSSESEPPFHDILEMFEKDHAHDDPESSEIISAETISFANQIKPMEEPMKQEKPRESISHVFEGSIELIDPPQLKNGPLLHPEIHFEPLLSVNGIPEPILENIEATLKVEKRDVGGLKHSLENRFKRAASARNDGHAVLNDMHEENHEFGHIAGDLAHQLLNSANNAAHNNLDHNAGSHSNSDMNDNRFRPSIGNENHFDDRDDIEHNHANENSNSRFNAINRSTNDRGSSNYEKDQGTISNEDSRFSPINRANSAFNNDNQHNPREQFGKHSNSGSGMAGHISNSGSHASNHFFDEDRLNSDSESEAIRFRSTDDFSHDGKLNIGSSDDEHSISTSQTDADHMNSKNNGGSQSSRDSRMSNRQQEQSRRREDSETTMEPELSAFFNFLEPEMFNLDFEEEVNETGEEEMDPFPLLNPSMFDLNFEEDSNDTLYPDTEFDPNSATPSQPGRDNRNFNTLGSSRNLLTQNDGSNRGSSTRNTNSRSNSFNEQNRRNNFNRNSVSDNNNLAGSLNAFDRNNNRLELSPGVRGCSQILQSNFRPQCNWIPQRGTQLKIWPTFFEQKSICEGLYATLEQCQLLCEDEPSCEAIHYCEECIGHNCRLLSEAAGGRNRLQLINEFEFVDYWEKDCRFG